MPNPERRHPPAVPPRETPPLNVDRGTAKVIGADVIWAALRKLAQHVSDLHLSIPGGFFSSTPTTIQAGATASAGTETAGWMASDAVISIETAAPSHPTGTAASEGSGSALMRADATIAQGIVTTKGDLLGFAAVPARQAVGANALELRGDSGQATGLRWGPIVLSPAQITANTNDYAPGRANVYRLSTDASRNLTGIVAGTSGERRTLSNVGAQPLVLKHQDAASAAPNRFLSTTGADITLAADEIAEILYDATTARWRIAKW